MTLDDVEHADLFFLIGGNPASNHPRLMRTLMNLRRRGGHVVVVNPMKEVGLVNFSPMVLVGRNTLPAETMSEMTAWMKLHGPDVKFAHAGSGTLAHLRDHIAMGVFDVFQIPYSAVEREHETAISEAAVAGAGIVIRGGAAKGAPATEKQSGSGTLVVQGIQRGRDCSVKNLSKKSNIA